MSRFIRITAFALAILAFFIFVGSPFGQSAKAIVGIDDALIAVIIAALSAMGLTFAVSSAYGSLEAYVSDLIEEYAAARQMTPQQLFVGVNTGTNKLGQLLLNNRFVLLLQGFASWLIIKFGIQDNTVTVLQAPAVTLDNYTVYMMPVAIRYTRPGSSANRVEIIVINSATQGYVTFGQIDSQHFEIQYFSESPVTIRSTWYRSDGSSTAMNEVALSRTGFPFVPARETEKYYVGLSGTQDFTDYDLSPYILYDYRELRDAIANASDVQASDTQIELHADNIKLPLDDDTYSEGDGAILDLDTGWGVGYGDVTEGVIPGEYSDGQVGEADITYAPEDEVAEQVEDTPASTISSNPSDYQAPGLPDVFPFCIPFDIYAFFECLAADPVAPSFTWRFYVPGICDEEIELDLSDFDSVAQIVRTMELLAFIVGLALVTRNRFLRG